MPILDDSGIESEDKLSNVFEDAPMAPQKNHESSVGTAQHMANLEVSFRAAGAAPTRAATRKDAGKGTYTPVTDSDEGGAVVRLQPPNTCRILQRKLELKVERAKRNYNQHLEEHAKKTQSAHLIPISRLSIPGDLEQKPLVDYKSDSSSDETEEISFFPAKLKNARRQKKAELSDTFSIQEMTIDSELDSEDSGSQNLELLSPVVKANILDKLSRCFSCCCAS